MPFNFFTMYYGYYIGMQVRGTIGNIYTYQTYHGRTYRHRYIVPRDPKTPAQIRMRFLLGSATYAWHDLSSPEKLFWKDVRTRSRAYSGFNHFISSYIKTWQ